METTPARTTSPADQSFERLRKFLRERALFKSDDSQLSEADTRAKLVDPVFRDVLGWTEPEIRREKPVAKGFVDYVLGSDYSYLLIEAKRTAPRFYLNAPTKPRRLALSGPHLLGNKKIARFIEQAQGYASDVGVQFCVVSNGSQFIVFRPYLPGRPWRSGMAIVFHDHRDLEHNFSEFHSLLSRDAVVAGSLIEAFEHLERSTTQLYTALEQLPDADRDLVRNRVWQQIARIMGPLLTDQSENPAVQLEIISNCYVSTPLADQTDESLDRLLKDVPAPDLIAAKFVDLRPGHRGRTAFSHRLRSDVEAARAGTYILTGGVGSGKTTFLKRFAYLIDRDLVERYTVWVHIDFLPIGNLDAAVMDRELREYVYKHIRTEVENQFGPDLAATGEQIRELFAEEIKQASLTRLHGLPTDSPEWQQAVNGIVDEHYRSNELFSLAALRSLRKRGKRVAVVFDNTDQLGESFQENVFLFAQKVSSDYAALCIVVLREEKFFAAYRRGIFDAFGDRRFHIGSPDLRQVLRKRLEYGRQKFAKLASGTSDEGINAGEIARADALLRSLIMSTTGRNANIVRMLASVSNGDMRHALDMFREFLSSGNTNVEKIIDIMERGGGYTVPFHEFAKSAILGSRKYYRSNVSHIVNLFKQSDALGASHVTACRILARLASAEGTASAHGEGFVAVSTLLREYRSSFGFADDLVQWVGELLRRNLVESEPPRAANLDAADAVRITAAGAYYWKYLVRAFGYIDLVFVDTPVVDRTLARKLAELADSSDMIVRVQRVRAFLEYLARKEAEELAISAERAGPFQQSLLPDIRARIEAEIKVIGRKLSISAELTPATRSRGIVHERPAVVGEPQEAVP
jgi:hypothetical protein